ncbi:hypothetical protein BJ875DRAFT_477476 [Amylocarpus encephaloides]|uniref:Uncharacterized protein n=1 Tax=Amylocarpus encephaloides TaxID=45428 RepID=A0A9P8BZW4_9HELO|nr:hypothetical protein BJ875DRAFT_477476 [Amylocarpus encephaloides]
MASPTSMIMSEKGLLAPSTSGTSPFTLFVDKFSRATTVAWKKVKRAFKDKEPSDPFLKTVKIFSTPLDCYVDSKMRLDTGCEVHNLITLDVVRRLHLSDKVIIHSEPIFTCLNGEQFISTGAIVLRWKGKCFRKIFTTVFHVVNGDSLPWEIILGAETIREHSILKFAGFGGSTPILSKMTKGEKAQADSRKQEHKKEAAANDAKVKADTGRRRKLLGRLSLMPTAPAQEDPEDIVARAVQKGLQRQ